MTTCPQPDDSSGVAFGDLTVGSRVRFTRPATVRYADDPGYGSGEMTIEGTVAYVNPRGEVLLQDAVYEGEDLGDYYGTRPSEVRLLEDDQLGEWFWEVRVVKVTSR